MDLYSDEIRWKQRFDNFEKSFILFKSLISLEEYDEIERLAFVKSFEMVFELSWKLLKDYLELEGFIVKSPRQTIKQAFEISLIKKGDIYLKALEIRNNLAHRYDDEYSNEVISFIKCEFIEELDELYKFFKGRL